MIDYAYMNSPFYIVKIKMEAAHKKFLIDRKVTIKRHLHTFISCNLRFETITGRVSI